jgi:predicted house-cleaning noncanonical NTP pyrophosphatase (MazG superfamily)
MGKLVRDRIPEIIEASGRIALVRRLTDSEFERALRLKLIEEATEACEASDSELVTELADVLEVFLGLATLHGLTLEAIEAARMKKESERGNFSKRLFLE